MSDEASKKGLSRRTVVGLSLGTITLVAGGVFALRALRFADLPESSRRLALAVAERIDDLDLSVSDELIERWATDREAFGEPMKLRKGRATHKQVQSFLLSTDLLAAERDGQPEAVTRYVAYYSPHKTPCYNPLIRVES